MRSRVSRRYMKACINLYGDKIEAGELGIKPAKKKKTRKPEVLCASEADEQIRLHIWMTKKGIIHHHSPNGGKRNLGEAQKFKAMGVSAGYPDLTIPYARKGSHGLFLELKRVSGGVLSDSQAWWRDFLLRQGYAWYEVRGFDEGVKIISEYLEIKVKD